MGDFVFLIDENDLKSDFYRCRICHEEEKESYFEAPCACSGTVKFAHRDCIQRWCDEKGNTICEICLQEYKPGYTTTSKPSKLTEAEITIRDDLEMARRRDIRRRNRRRLMERDESEYNESNTYAHRLSSSFPYLLLFFSVVLLIQQGFDVVHGTNEYPFPILTVITLKFIGIILPVTAIIRTIAAIQRTLQHRFLESEEDTLSSDEDDNYLEEEEQRQQQHLA